MCCCESTDTDLPTLDFPDLTRCLTYSRFPKLFAGLKIELDIGVVFSKPAF
jgi:hypothetical protein